MRNARYALNLTSSLAIYCLLTFAATCAWAQQNLLTNPGFESGDFSGWTVGGNSTNYGVNVNGFVIQGTDPSFGPTSVIVHSGTYAGYTLVCGSGCVPPHGMGLQLSQTLQLAPGNVYTVGFWVGNGSQVVLGNSSDVLVNGQQVNLTTYPGQLNPQTYGLASGTFLATQANNTVTFEISGSGDGIGGFSFDDFSLVLNTLQPGNGTYAYLVQQNNDKVASYQVNLYSGMFVPGTGSPFNTGASPVAVAATSNLIYVADQGSSQISAYSINFNNGTMIPVPGSPYPAHLAPEALAIDHNLHFLYASGLDSNGNGAISGWVYAPALGAITPVPGSPFPAGTAPGAIAFDRSGQHAYVVDSANNQLLAYSINSSTGALTPLAGSPYSTGRKPSSVVVDVTSNYLYVANSSDGNISGFAIGSSGALTHLAGSPFPTGNTPVALTIDTTQRYVYAANSGSNNIWSYQIIPGFGSLTPVTNSPFTTGTDPDSIAASPGFIYANTSGGVYAFQIGGATGTLTPVPGSPLPFFGTAIATNDGSGGNAP